MTPPDLLAHALRLPDRDGRERLEIPSILFVRACEATRREVSGSYAPS